MTTQVAVPVSSIPGAWLVDASGSVIFRHPDVPEELTELAACDTVIRCAGRAWRVRVTDIDGARAGAALPL